jgi:menaquinone-dependent protoporphyrinogen oxidase
MGRIAVLYDSTEGQTANIADAIGEIATSAGHDVSVRDVRELPDDFGLESFDGFIVGASIHVGKHSRPFTAFVKRSRRLLEARPSAFFSVSLSAAGKTEEKKQEAQRYLKEFLSETEWTPQVTATFAGALRYREYNFFKRLIMKWIAKNEGGDTDTSRNYEYTDWGQVHTFVGEFLRQVGQRKT